MVNTGTSPPATNDVESPGDETITSPPPEGRSWLIPVATVLGFAIPAVSYLWMIHAYGVNVIFWDQLDDVALIGHAYSGTLHFSTLWAQHNENRIFFPNLIVLALAYTTHLNVVTEEYLSAFMLFGGTALIIGAHKRRSPERRWICYCPVAFLMLSLAQAGNALWGFQMAWYLVLLMVALSLFLLDNESLSWLVFAGAIAAAVVASYSSIQGLLVWPAGLLLIYLRRRTFPFALAWIGAAVVTGVIYFVGFNSVASLTPTQDPTAVLTFFVRVVGDIVGESQPGALVTLFGWVLIVMAVWVLVQFATRERSTTGGRPFALSLILFGLLFSALTASGRGFAGINVEYRYTVFAIFVLVGLYLAVLDPLLASSKRRGGRGEHALSDILLTVARVVVGVGIVLTVILGSTNGVSQARANRQIRLLMGQITVRASQYPDPIVRALSSWLEPASFIRRQITVAKEHDLSLFGTGDAAKYLSEKPLKFGPFPPARAAIVVPRAGSTLQGKQLIDVVIADSFDVTRVDFFLSRPGFATVSLATGVGSDFGWWARWNTSTVPNGTYAIDATVTDSGGRSVTTSPVEVRVDNGNRSGS